MLVGCPKCKTRYRINDEKLGTDGIVLRCVRCRAVFRLAGKAASIPVVRPIQPESDGTDKWISVLVANESPAFCQAVKKILENDPVFNVFTCCDGKTALAAIEEMLPDVVVLDVALPLMYGFEVCEAVRKNPATAAVKIILLAAIYDKTRYKREPNSLYGADDYIEKHHIHDLLVAKIYRLVSGRDVSPEEGSKQTNAGQDVQAVAQEFSDQEMAVQENCRMEIMLDKQPETGAVSLPQDSEAYVKARRLARLIVSDIVLYNQELVEEGILNDSFHTLLEEDIQEGKALYETRIPAEIRDCTSYLEDAFEAFVTRKKMEMQTIRDPGECCE